MVRFRRHMEMSKRMVCLGLTWVLIFYPGIGGHAQSLQDGGTGDVPEPGFQKSRFPDWMNETSDNVTPKDTTPKVAEPVEPIDPDADAGKAARQERESRPRFQFTPPKMPDVSRFREQSTRTVTEQDAASSSQRLEQTSAAGLLPLASNILASFTMPAVNVPAGQPPKADIPKRFYRPTGYRSFMQESLADKPGDETESTTPTGE